MTEFVRPLAELIVGFGANVQPGQIVSLYSEPGKEQLARAVAEAAYRAGAKFVDLSVFDLHLKRARALHADPASLGYVPPWYGERKLALGAAHAAEIVLAGPSPPGLMDGLDPELLGRDMLPRLAESSRVIEQRLTNWVVAPCPTLEWAEMIRPELAPDEALSRLWSEMAHVCRLDEADPVVAWRARQAELEAVSDKLTQLRLDSLHFEGPGTSLDVGLLGSGTWMAARMTTATGIVHTPNIPTEEVFTSPDPERVDGYVRSTKPLLTSGALVRDLWVRFEGGRVVEAGAGAGAGTFTALASRDEGASRLGEVALVDRAGRIGSLGTVFYETLLDENAASHIAIGDGFSFLIEDPQEKARVNHSEVHLDFMIGGDAVDVTGTTRAGEEVPLLRSGHWQI